ncbi:MAG: hypothetical protein H6667_02285 [Ardenticatenaceae bacterium]|nr:hypothetical protein [Ardenticatenaceae bacterium]MCB9443338.1 hypothetical protein [Ardenticatenaceae bacterium]
MSQERFEVGKQPHIEITECMGDLVVRSWAETAVLIKSGDYKTNETESGLTITSQDSLKLTIPEASSLSIHTVHGDVEIKRVEGTISLQTAYGDAAIHGAGSLKIGTVQNDLAIKQIHGSVSVETVYGDTAVRGCDDLSLGAVHGDLSARAVDGTADIVEVYGDISLRGVSGSVTVKQGSRDANLRGLRGDSTHLPDIAGDIRLHGPLSSGEHRFTANGDIVLHWPSEEALTVTAVAPSIKNRLLSSVEESEDSLTGQIGENGPAVFLNTEGEIILKGMDREKSDWPDEGMAFDFDFDFDFADFNEKINSEVFAQVNRITDELETKFGPDFAERMAEKFAHKAEKEAVKVEKAAERAIRQAERAMRQAEQKMQRHRPPAPPRPPAAPFTAVKPKPKVSSEEQLKILKMVEKGIISPDEAGTLLNALEG